MSYTKAEREERWKKCIGYLAKKPCMADAIAAAKRDGVSYPTAVWITAMGKMLGEGRQPGDGR